MREALRDDSHVVELAGSFLRDTPQRLQALAAALLDDDLVLAAKIAQDVKGRAQMLRCDPAGRRVRCGEGGALECGRPAPACASSSVARCESSPGASNGSSRSRPKAAAEVITCKPIATQLPMTIHGHHRAAKRPRCFECAGHGGLLCRPAPGAQDQTPP
jgi:hypothetical protein